MLRIAEPDGALALAAVRPDACGIAWCPVTTPVPPLQPASSSCLLPQDYVPLRSLPPMPSSPAQRFSLPVIRAFPPPPHSPPSSHSLPQSLDTFNTAVVTPIYYVMFTTLTIVASVIMYKDWAGQTAEQVLMEFCGFLTILIGTYLLHATKDFAGDSSRLHLFDPSARKFSLSLCLYMLSHPLRLYVLLLPLYSRVPSLPHHPHRHLPAPRHQGLCWRLLPPTPLRPLCSYVLSLPLLSRVLSLPHVPHYSAAPLFFLLLFSLEWTGESASGRGSQRVDGGVSEWTGESASGRGSQRVEGDQQQVDGDQQRVEGDQQRVDGDQQWLQRLQGDGERTRGCEWIKQFTTSSSSPLQAVHHFKQFTTSSSSPLQAVHHFKQFTTSSSSPLQAVHHFKQFTTSSSSPLQAVHHFKQFTTSSSSPLQAVHHFKQFTSSSSSPLQGGRVPVTWV
ncbi:unnamed protein product [Closterium sp. NIES-54]